VYVPDPLAPSDVVVEALGAAFGPGYRVLSIEPRSGQPYQVQAADVLATLDQFGFLSPVLIGERLGCVAALLIAAWHPDRVASLVLVDPTYTAPPEHASSVEARALRDCPPDWPSLHAAVHCPVLVLHWDDAGVERLQTFLQLP
jgi:pimeloyl-ACP methyl ester carboxylesterase